MDWLNDHWGDLASTVGLVVAIIGFSVAFAQIKRSRRAAEAAERAVSATRESLARNLTIDDLARASQRFQQLKELHLERQWRRAIDRHYDIRVMLAQISSQHPGLTDTQQSTIQAAIQQVETLERLVVRAVREGTDPENLERHDAAMLRTQSLVDELASNLRQSV